MPARIYHLLTLCFAHRRMREALFPFHGPRAFSTCSICARHRSGPQNSNACGVHPPIVRAAETGAVRCPRKADSLTRYRTAAPQIDPDPGPGGPPAVRTQHSITIPPAAGAKHWQPHPYGTRAWQDQYHQLRATVEGTNGHAKDGAHENIADPGGRRVRGIAAQTFLLAFQIAHANTRKIDN